jgi:hypothetical protein
MESAPRFLGLTLEASESTFNQDYLTKVRLCEESVSFTITALLSGVLITMRISVITRFY